MSDGEKNARSKALGRAGEDRVAEYLRRNGYIIVQRNFRIRYGEIDIIAEDRENIVFVEVKTRSENAMVSGLEAMTPKKIAAIRRTGQLIAAQSHFGLEPRFDFAEVVCCRASDGSAVWKLRYCKNAF